MSPTRRVFVPEMPRDQQGSAWWQRCGLTEFRRRVEHMQPLEIEILLEEVQGAVGVVQSQLEARGKTNYEWWQKARQALGYIVEKRNLLRSLVKDHKRIKESVSKQRRREWRSARYAALNAIRERLGSEETEKVVGDLIELIMEDYAPKEPRPS